MSAGDRTERSSSRERKSRDLGLRDRQTGTGQRGRSDRETSQAGDDMEYEGFSEEYDGDEATDSSHHGVEGRVRGRADRDRHHGDEGQDPLSGPYAESRWGLRAMETIQKIVDSGVTLGHRVSE